MKIFVNNQEVELLPGMTVRHALICAGLQKTQPEELRVTDEWGNTIGMDGALDEGARIITDSGIEPTHPKTNYSSGERKGR